MDSPVLNGSEYRAASGRDRQGRHAAAMSFCRHAIRAALGVDQTQHLTKVTDGQGTAVRRKGHPASVNASVGQNANLFAGSGIPNADGSILLASRELAAIR